MDSRGISWRDGLVSFFWLPVLWLIPNINQAQAPAYIWSRMLPGNVESIQRGTVVDGSGNVYICGAFWGSVDFDPGPGSATLTPPVYGTSGYLAKYDINGNYLWAKYIPQVTWVNAIALDPTGLPVITGMFSGSVDFDPGPGSTVLTTTPSTATAAYITKFGANGNFQWVRALMASASPDAGNDLVIDASNNIYLTGRFSGTIDVDPGAGVLNLAATGSTDVFMVKYDAGGSPIWARSMGSADLEDVNELVVGPAGSVYILGSFRSTMDADPGPGVCNLVASGTLSDMFLARYDASGNHLWSFRVGSTGNDIGSSMVVDAGGNVTVASTFSGTVDVDPGPGVTNLTSALGGGSFFARYTASGALVWAKYLPLNAADIDIAADPTGRYFLAGDYLTGSSPIDMDPGTAVANVTVVGGGFTPLYNHVLAKYDANGNYLWAGVFGHSCYCNVSGYKASLAWLPGGSLYYTGIFQAGYGSGTVDFDPSAAVSTLTAPSSVDNVFFAKYFDQSVLLPVELLSFKGEARNGVDHLFWSTATERNSDRFEVERSADGMVFDRIGTVPCAGYSEEQLDYSYDDLMPLQGLNCYRLKQVDYDGQFVHSPMITLMNESPAAECVIRTIDDAGVYAFNCLVGSQATVEVYSAEGRSLFAKRLSAGTSELIDLRSYTSGTYLARVVDAGSARSYKLVRQ